MDENKKKLRTKKSKKLRKKATPQNRYMRYSKLSEYKFLQILQGFADDAPIQDLTAKTRVSDKTIRNTYAAIRKRLLQATILYPERFGGAGIFLYQDGKLSHSGKIFLEEVYNSEIYETHVKRHAPRLNDDSPDADSYIIEVCIRVLCHLALNKDSETMFPPETHQALKNAQDIADWIREEQDKDGFMENYGWLVERFEELKKRIPILLQEDALQTLATKSDWHRYPNTILYDDLRRYLLKFPL